MKPIKNKALEFVDCFYIAYMLIALILLLSTCTGLWHRMPSVWMILIASVPAAVVGGAMIWTLDLLYALAMEIETHLEKKRKKKAHAE